jgi:hypothetical protein
VKGADELMSQLKEVKPYLFSKSASEMTPEEAAAALAELRRGPKPEPPAPIPVDRHARDMSPEERAEWLRGHARRFG